MSVLISRLVLFLLIARAIAAPVALRPGHSDRPLCDALVLGAIQSDGVAVPVPPQPQWEERAGPGTLVFRICAWPHDKGRPVTPDLVRSRAKSRALVRLELAVYPLANSSTRPWFAGLSPPNAINHYLNQSPGQLRC